jgi:hypothetical protein
MKSLVLYCAVAIVFLSCRPKYLPVEFLSGNTWSDKYSFRSEDGAIRVRLIADSDVGCNYEYRLHLDVRVDGRNLVERLSLDTARLQVILGDAPLTLHVEGYTSGPWLSHERYLCELGYGLDVSRVSAWADSVESTIRIVDQGFLMIDGVVLSLDTVLARDPQLEKLCGK